ncbi:MAG: hypothetical protein A2V66_05575 [Ignavibacteria bacterium RBG_13_36_8]|nr:MAG: hypothetical protein A2V66_05575 [Ignavibacteria bacterium RBG_13_36_8]
MQFVVIAYDGDDDNALERRMSVHDSHVNLAKEMLDSKRWLYAAGILDDNEKMIGSMVVCEFESRAQLEEEWFKKEPYILEDVWKKIKIHRAHVPSFLLTK